MKTQPLRTTVIGSYPFPGWLEFACQHLGQFGDADRAEMVDDAVAIAVKDQLDAGLDVISDGEQTRLDFNLSFYGFIEGIELESAAPRRFGPPAHDQRGKHKVIGELRAPRGFGAVEDFERLKRVAAVSGQLEGVSAGAIHLERTAAAERSIQEPLGADGVFAAACARGVGGAGARRLHGDLRG